MKVSFLVTIKYYKNIFLFLLGYSRDNQNADTAKEKSRRCPARRGSDVGGSVIRVSQKLKKIDYKIKKHIIHIYNCVLLD